MADLTYEEWRAQWDVHLTEAEKAAIRVKCEWEHMTPWQVLNVWPTLRAISTRYPETTSATGDSSVQEGQGETDPRWVTLRPRTSLKKRRELEDIIHERHQRAQEGQGEA